MRKQDWPWAYRWGTGKTHRSIAHILPAWCHRDHLRTSRLSIGRRSMVTAVFGAGTALWEQSGESNAGGAKKMVCVWIGNWSFSWWRSAGDAVVLANPLLFRWHKWPRGWQTFCSWISFGWIGVLIYYTLVKYQLGQFGFVWAKFYVQILQYVVLVSALSCCLVCR